MSLITACPACHTQFEVNDEQLQAYAGKVRCGECDHVFDAREFLLDAGTTGSAPTLEPEQTLAETSAPASTEDSLLVTDHADEYVETLISSAEVEHPSDPLWERHEETAQEIAIPEFLRNVSWAEAHPVPVEKTSIRWIFNLLSGVLVIALVLQMAYFSRTSLAANYPQAKPLLQGLCKVAQCDIALPQEIALLTIDDADIQEHRERDGVLVFSSVLINHGAVAQTYPLIELTLTNMADEPVLRKILKPAEYLPSGSRMAEGLAGQQELPVKVALGVEDKSVTGFRVSIAY